MTEEITTVKYLIDQLVDVKVACQFWIDKDHESQERIDKLEEHNTLLKERFEKDEASYLDATKAAFKRYIDAEGIRPNERFSKVVKQLQMYLPTDNESIDDKKIILMQSKRINELTEQLAHSYDSGLEAVHPEDSSEEYPEPTPEEQEMYQEHICQEIDAEQYE